ncbi:TIGR00366 family protein [Abyssibacter sp.]|jgi:uncharacterized ion transporter superfamily protein YfcC|uniref:YfcC family protein n=1 Tax=Abyssibacter sp. TaxID=2320200 RepID=UPI0025B842EF|nr:TIGR00366 family protein [Abyssibacter sp.]MCK5860144.1 YfcC family protein [Abyssibacter sp.]
MSRFRVPHTLVLLYAMTVVAFALTWLLPAGSYDTAINEDGREVVVPGTFQVLDAAPEVPVWSLVTVIPRALESAQGIIFFVLIIGGALGVLQSTGAVDAGLARLLRRFDARPGLLVAIGILSFSLGSSSIGMGEEYIALGAVLAALCIALRMDAVTAAAILVIGNSIGYGAAVLNPFTVLIAQDIAELPPLSGSGYRIALFLPLLGLGIWHVWRYARRVRANAAESLVADIPEAQVALAEDPPALTGRLQAVLWSAGLLLGIAVWGIITQGWYLEELSATFFAMAVVAGLVAGQSVNTIAKQFSTGAAALAGTALMIGFARSIEVMLNDGQILHTIVHGLSVPLSAVGSAASAVGMFWIQCGINFFVPSGSGQAYVTMPLMAPIADVLSLPRQVAVLAYQLGDGLTTMLNPADAVLMGILGVCGVPYGRWLRFIWPLALQVLVFGTVAMVVAVLIGYS